VYYGLGQQNGGKKLLQQIKQAGKITAGPAEIPTFAEFSAAFWDWGKAMI
jgi:hypothetical protein